MLARAPKTTAKSPYYSWIAADPDAMVVGDFSIQLSPIDRSSRQQFNQELQN
jgi:hypothetical protein